MSRSEYPLLHVYPQRNPGEAVRIVGNTLGLSLLVNTLIDAISLTGEGKNEFLCVDAEVYEVQVTRDDYDPAWDELGLPYIKG